MNKPNTTSNKRTNSTNKTNNLTTNKNNKFLDNNQRQGIGLWCVNTTKSKISNAPNEITYSNKINIDKEQDYLIAPKLRDQLNQLTEDLHKSLVKTNELEYKSKKQEDKIDDLTKENSLITKELTEIRELDKELKSTILSQNEALNAAKKEIIRLNTYLENENLKNKNLKNDIYQLKSREEEQVNELKAIISNKDNKIRELIDQTNEYKEKLNKNIVNMDKLTKLSLENKQLEEKLIQSENRYNKTVNELLELKLKYSEEDGAKSKLNLIIKSKNDKIEQIKNDYKTVKSFNDQINSDLKWNQEQILQKDKVISTLKDKIKSLEDDLKNAEKAYASLKKIKSNNEVVNNDENIVKIQAKPYLFGPEDD